MDMLPLPLAEDKVKAVGRVMAEAKVTVVAKVEATVVAMVEAMVVATAAPSSRE